MDSQHGVTVKLTPREYRLARRDAKERAENRRPYEAQRAKNRHEPIPDQPGQSRSFGQRSLEGVLGELAFSKYTDIAMQNHNQGPDGGIDFTVDWRDEKAKVDVKTTQHEHGCVQVTEGKVVADIYPLAVVRDPNELRLNGELCEVTLDFVGYATADEIDCKEVVKGRYSDKWLHRVPQSELHEMPSSEDIREHRNQPPREEREPF